MQSTILSAYLALCQRFQLGPVWGKIAADPWAFQGPADPSTVLPALSAVYAEQELLAAQIAVRSGDRTVQLNPLLDSPNLSLFALRSKGKILSLVTSHGCLHDTYWPPLFAAQCDDLTRKWIARNENILVLTGEIEDAIALRAIGVAAVPVAGFDRLRTADWTYLYDHADFSELVLDTDLGDTPAVEWGESVSTTPATGSSPEPAADQSIGTPPLGSDPSTASDEVESELHLVFAEWRPRDLTREIPAAVHSAKSFFQDLQDFAQMHLDSMGTWVPTPIELRNCRFAIKLPSKTLARKQLVEGLADKAYRIDRVVPNQDEAATPIDLAVASRELAEAAQGDQSVEFKRQKYLQARKRYQRAVEREIIGPMYDQAAAAISPLDKVLVHQLSQMLAIVSEKTLAANESLWMGAGAVTQLKTTQELLKVNSQLLEFIREARKCRVANKMPTRRAPATPWGPRFGAFASLLNN